MDVHQTYASNALWDRDDLLNLGVKKVKVKVTVQ